jgi:rhodanese-related sulfurtransferase
MRLTKGFRALLAEAEQIIDTVSVAEVERLLGDTDTVIVDLREPEELAEHGRIPGSVHAVRGELEFLVDPESPFHMEVFASGKRLVLHCAAGWRSALAARTLLEMGVPRVAHMAGGFEAWTAAGAPVEPMPQP